MRLHGSLELVWGWCCPPPYAHMPPWAAYIWHSHREHCNCIHHFIAIDSYHFACHQFNRVTEFTTSYSIPCPACSCCAGSRRNCGILWILSVAIIFGIASTLDAFESWNFRNQTRWRNCLVECNLHANICTLCLMWIWCQRRRVRTYRCHRNAIIMRRESWSGRPSNRAQSPNAHGVKKRCTNQLRPLEIVLANEHS